MRKTVLILALGLFLFSKGMAQNKPDLDNYWIEAGSGMYNNPNVGGFSTAYWFNYQHSNILYRARYVQNHEFNLFGPSPNESDRSFGIMIGKFKSNNYLSFNASIGLGITAGNTRGNLIKKGSYSFYGPITEDYYEKKTFISPSIPIELDFNIKPLKFLGVGASIIGDANLNRPYMGFMLKAGFGKFR